MHHAPPNIYFSLHSDIFERLLAELVLTQGLATSSNWTVRGTAREDAVHARLAHLVVAFWVDEKSHIGIQVSRGFADGADL